MPNRQTISLYEKMLEDKVGCVAYGCRVIPRWMSGEYGDYDAELGNKDFVIGFVVQQTKGDYWWDLYLDGISSNPRSGYYKNYETAVKKCERLLERQMKKNGYNLRGDEE